MSRRMWIGFYALALSLFVGLLLASLVICINGIITHLWVECITVPLIPLMVWLSWITFGLLRQKLRALDVDGNSGSKAIEAGHDQQEQKPELNPSRNGEWRAAAMVVLALAAFIALLWLADRSGLLIAAFIVLLCISAPFGNKLIGSARAVQLASPTIERQSQRRYHSEFEQLAKIGFKPLFIFGESRSLYRLFLIYPVYLYTVMLLNREIATVKGSRIVFGNPVLVSDDGKAYVHIMQLGLKFYTRFQDGSILLTKSFGGTTKYGSNVIFQRRCDGSIYGVWMEHHDRVHQLEAEGKQVVEEVGFDAFSRIWDEA